MRDRLRRTPKPAFATAARSRAHASGVEIVPGPPKFASERAFRAASRKALTNAERSISIHQLQLVEHNPNPHKPTARGLNTSLPRRHSPFTISTGSAKTATELVLKTGCRAEYSSKVISFSRQSCTLRPGSAYFGTASEAPRQKPRMP